MFMCTSVNDIMPGRKTVKVSRKNRQGFGLVRKLRPNTHTQWDLKGNLEGLKSGSVREKDKQASKNTHKLKHTHTHTGVVR